MLKEVPNWDIKKIRYGVERGAMADLVGEIASGFQEDWFPGENPWEALQMSAILLKMFQIHQAGKMATAGAISRMGIPRTTVHRKLIALRKRGLIEQYGTKFVLSIDGVNAPHLLEGFVKRLVSVRQHLSKMLATLPTDQTRAVHRSVLDTRTTRPR